MQFKSLKEKCEYYRDLADHKLMPGTYVLAMLDGRSFSKMIKKKFQLPFDDVFIGMMNKTAEILCSKVQGARFAYVQSDEISLVLTDFGGSDSFFGYRCCKMLSILSSIATGYFNKLLLQHYGVENIESFEPVQFDCKVWNVPTLNDVYAWFLYRQLDCEKNSKQQLAQQYYSHKQLEGLATDDQVQMLKDQKGISWWQDFDAGKQIGRFIWREEKKMYNEQAKTEYIRHVWITHPAYDLKEKEGRERFINNPDLPILDYQFRPISLESDKPLTLVVRGDMDGCGDLEATWQISYDEARQLKKALETAEFLDYFDEPEKGISRKTGKILDKKTGIPKETWKIIEKYIPSDPLSKNYVRNIYSWDIYNNDGSFSWDNIV